MSPGKVPVLQRGQLPLVGVGKHLCGAATGESWVSCSSPMNKETSVTFDLCWGRGFRSGATLSAGHGGTQRRD